MTTKSTAKITAVKPAKPRPDFPWFAHATRRWAKKIRRRLCYFGPRNDPDGAIERYLDQKDDLYAGRTPRPGSGTLTVRDALNHLLTATRLLVDSGEILPTTFAEYHQVCAAIAEQFGIRRPVEDSVAADFDRFRPRMARRWGPIRLADSVQRVRSVFLYTFESGLIDRPIRCC